MSGSTVRTVLDTAFGDGARLAALVDARTASDPWLHYVVVVPPGWDSRSGPPSLSTITPFMLAAAGDVQRCELEAARIRLTVYAGSADGLIGALALQADTVWWQHVPESDNAEATIKALARLCVEGASIQTTAAWAALPGWQAAGFVPVDGALRFAYAPPWRLRRTRKLQRDVMAAPARCAVIGAGISGAALADAMAHRGWAVTVFDTHSQPAQGGSGVPAALVAPLPSADDNPATRLTRHGLRWMRQTLYALSARGLLRQGLDWEACGVTRVLESGERQWQPDGLWLRPAALVQAWLAHPEIAFYGEHPVVRLTRHGVLWHIEGKDGKLLAQAELVLLANGLDCQSLLRAVETEPRAASAVAKLHAAFGTISIGMADDVANRPATPVNGAGSLIPALPGATGAESQQWLVGADFSAQPLPIAQAHAANLQRLQTLAPDMHAEPLAHWQGQRCVSHDRLPLVGPLLAAPDATLWLCTGMGARGMAWAGICAELLASRISGEPWPLARDLARHVDSQRRRAFIRDKA
jgi:tRNA 5-methylaminomethyl-2-thiouridine biosynthesis bifunctional protein